MRESRLYFHRGALPGEPSSARFLDVDGVRIRYVDSESELPVVVLVHGFASSLDVWEPVTAALAATHRVIALDLKGFGWTDRPEGDYSPAAQADLLLHFLDARGVGDFAIVAHSWGSSVALSATLAQPERVTRLALYDAWVYEDQLPPFFHWAQADGIGEMMFGMYYRERADERIELAFHDRTFITATMVEDVVAGLNRPGTVAAALAAVRGQRYAEMERKYHRVEQPTLLLWGREDRVAALKFGERLAQEMPNARLVTYGRCGHFPMIEAKETSTRDVLAFMNESEQKRRTA